ncbi:MAG: helix-turn-helix transcriptional regulator [Promethearchaeota archaeon]
MTEADEYELDHKGFIILGLIAEYPNGNHAYSVNKRIQERGMRNWTNIGKSSIYRIANELEEHGLVVSFEEEHDNRVRKIYKVTDFGFQILKDKVYNVLKEYYGRNGENFYVAFSMLPLLSIDQQVEAIMSSIEKLKVHIKELEDMLTMNSRRSLNVRGLFIHPIKVMQTDVEFLEGVLKEIKRGGGKDKAITNDSRY